MPLVPNLIEKTDEFSLQLFLTPQECYSSCNKHKHATEGEAVD